MPNHLSRDPEAEGGPRIARVLPTNVRKRVFLPAYYDLQARGVADSSLARRVLALIADSLRVGSLDWLTRDRRLRRAGRVLASIGLALFTLGLLAAAFLPEY